MAIRKAYVDWNKFGPDTKLENRKKYMVCTADGDTCDLRFVTYYDAGTVIKVGLSEDADVGQERTAEEKLLSALFGRSKAFAVPEDGFYVLTADYGVDGDECNGAFRDCKEQPVCVGNRNGWDGERDSMPAYWAEVPVLPAGLRLVSEERPGPAASDWVRGKVRAVEEKLEGDPLAATVYKYVMKERDLAGGPVDFPLGGAVYAMSPVWFATALVDVHGTCTALAKIPADEVTEFWDSLGPMDADGAVKATGGFCKAHGIPEGMYWLVFQYVRNLRGDFRDFCHYRDRALRAGGTRSLNLPAVLQEALGMYKIQFWVGRCVRMEALGAPEIIRSNELRMLVEYVAMAKLGDRIVQVLPDFDELYGVHPDGSRGERRCEYGDKELARLPGQDDPDGDDGDDDGSDDGESDGGDECEACPKVIGVDYPYFAGILAPNFLMRQCRYVIWDNSEFEYVRDASGRIEQFDGFPSERLAELNGAAMAASGKTGDA